ncbi:uncharacterized protein LOC122643522 [Telopea speciosissima]|uniref:uncharacterized protein LOC122643522 n=1 Tax=Telopea speciosissima TaxID=54955 RepID=UPI001CC43283|nr:uncharacterized protein LOC122643522 [Telopea speciosissima]
MKHDSGHSGETISQYFNKVVHAILNLYPVLLKPPSTTTHEKILNNRRSFYPYFKNCIGAIDGSHIPAWVPVANHCRFRDRKGNISQNILAACDHDRRFTYILSDWEGSTVDSRILDEAFIGKVKPSYWYLQYDTSDEDEVEDDDSGDEDDGGTVDYDQLREEIADNMWDGWITGNMDVEDTSDSLAD